MKNYWFISVKKNERLVPLILVTFIVAAIVILLGAFTRLNDAGLSCPDWPHCYGFITAPHTTTQLLQASQIYPASPVNVRKAWIEMTHRYFAGIESILIIVLSISLIVTGGLSKLKTYLLSSGLIGLLAIQVLLGMLTVTAKLKPIIVLAHLLTGLSLLILLWTLYLNFKLQKKFKRNPLKVTVIPWLCLGLIIVTLQIILGGWVSTHYAGLACIDFPYCNGQLLPELQWNNLDNDLITIHMLHRLGALFTFVTIGCLALFLLFERSLRFFGCVLGALLLLQILLGILNIIWLRPIWIALSHQAVAILLLLTLFTTLFKAYVGSKDNHYDSWIT